MAVTRDDVKAVFDAANAASDPGSARIALVDGLYPLFNGAGGGGGSLGPDLIAIEALTGAGIPRRVSDGVWSILPVDVVSRKSHILADLLPAGGDNIPLLYAKTPAAIESVRVVLAGGASSSAVFDIYYSSNRSAGASGTKLTDLPVSVSDTSQGVLVELNTVAISAGSFVYALVHSAAIADILEFHISYTGGD